jgi:hypothetical protein
VSQLDDLLAQAREADRADRINLRDPIAAVGESAIEPMTDWLGDPQLAAFAIRVLERIGREPTERSAVIAVLRAVDRTELPPHLIGDLDTSLMALGGSTIQTRRERSPSGGGTMRPPGMPGVPGRGYWVMRTSPWERPYIWAEAQAGRLRQGWGTQEDQNLEVIAAALRRGDTLSESQREARRALRMLTSWEHGMRFGDVVVAPNLPEYGRLSIARVTGSYEWAPASPLRFGERFGHVLPVEMLITDIDRRGPGVSDGLRSVLGVQTRLYSMSGYGGDVERLLGGEATADRRGELWTEAEYEHLFGRLPPDGPRPTDGEVEMVAIGLGRTPDAISWQWGDGAAYRGGGSASTMSEPLKVWLDRRGLGG